MLGLIKTQVSPIRKSSWKSWHDSDLNPEVTSLSMHDRNASSVWLWPCICVILANFLRNVAANTLPNLTVFAFLAIVLLRYFLTNLIVRFWPTRLTESTTIANIYYSDIYLTVLIWTTVSEADTTRHFYARLLNWMTEILLLEIYTNIVINRHGTCCYLTLLFSSYISISAYCILHL